MGFDISDFTETRIAAPIRIMTEDKAAALAKEVARARALGPDTEIGLRKNAHHLFPWMFDVATSDAVLDSVASVLGPDILIWASGLFIKDPNDGGYISWHQDSTYWGLEPPTIVTAWIAFTPSTVGSGCLKVAPGTHKMAQLPHVDGSNEKNMLSRAQEVAVDVSKLETANIELQPGEMSLHHVQLVHGSDPNRASWPRLGYAIRFIPTSVRQTGGRTIAVLARGKDRFGHFDLVGRPDAEMSTAAVATALESDRRIQPILMDGAEQ
jgi:ectoine hydroxylase-related dioxygenase (phytanoyl-CoA dioxygenase family)